MLIESMCCDEKGNFAFRVEGSRDNMPIPSLPTIKSVGGMARWVTREQDKAVRDAEEEVKRRARIDTGCYYYVDSRDAAHSEDRTRFFLPYWVFYK